MMQSELTPKVLHITEDQVHAFAGRKTLEQISHELLNEIKELDFANYLGLPKGSSIRQKHQVVAVVKRLLEVSQDNRWNMAKAYGSIYLFNGCFWQQMEKEELKSLLSKTASKMGMPEYDAIHFEFKDKLLKQFLTYAHLTSPKNKSTSILINLLNGTFEITPEGNRLREFEPADFLTNQLPFEYDPGAQCPLFDRFLLRVLPDDSCRMVLQEFAGYIFSDLNLEKMLILTGSGSNGKSVFFNILCALIGKNNILNYPLGSFAKDTYRAQLPNILLNYSSEKGIDLDPDMLKILISCESTQARNLYGMPFTIDFKTKFIANANELSRLTEHNEAYFRRQLIIPFNEKIADSEKDIHLADKIIASELPGIFNWLLHGLCRLMNQQSFTYSFQIENAVQDYKRQSDSVALYVDDKKYAKSSTNKEAIAELYPSYKTFCYDDGYKAVSKNKFSTRLENLGFEKTRLSGGGAAYFMEIDYTIE